MTNEEWAYAQLTEAMKMTRHKASEGEGVAPEPIDPAGAAASQAAPAEAPAPRPHRDLADRVADLERRLDALAPEKEKK